MTQFYSLLTSCTGCMRGVGLLHIVVFHGLVVFVNIKVFVCELTLCSSRQQRMRSRISPHCAEQFICVVLSQRRRQNFAPGAHGFRSSW